MAELDRWNGDGNNCLCVYCTNATLLLGKFGASCPACGNGVLSSDLVGWLECTQCDYQCREDLEVDNA